MPNYRGATATALSTYVDAGGQPVDLYVAVFDRQSEDAELVGYQQGVVPPTAEGEPGWSWAGGRNAPAGGSAAQINWGQAVRDVWQFYWVNGKVVGSPYAAKVEGLKARLLGGDPQAATIVVSAQRLDPLVSARPALERFTRDLGPLDKLVARSIVARRQLVES
jgi:EpsI family protein